jgi:hypothetical protein
MRGRELTGSTTTPQRTSISCDRHRTLKHRIHHHFRACMCTIIMSSTPSSRRRTTWCFLGIKSEGIVGKFNAPQHPAVSGRGENQRFGCC